jgi:hypothetical protein
MKRQMKPLHQLWVLFGLQIAVSICLLVLFAWFHIKMGHLVSHAQQDDAKIPQVRQHLEHDDPDRLHKDALALVDASAAQSQFVQTMETDWPNILGAVWFIFLGTTIWVGRITFQLSRAKGNAPAPVG